MSEDDRAFRQAAIALIEAVTPLLDPERVMPFTSAWEFDPHDLDTDGEVLHRALREAHAAAVLAIYPSRPTPPGEPQP